MSGNDLISYAQGRKVARTDEYMYEFTSSGEQNLFKRVNESDGTIDNQNEVVNQLHDSIDQAIGTEFIGRDETDIEIEDPLLRKNLRDLGYLV